MLTLLLTTLAAAAPSAPSAPFACSLEVLFADDTSTTELVFRREPARAASLWAASHELDDGAKLSLVVNEAVWDEPSRHWSVGATLTVTRELAGADAQLEAYAAVALDPRTREFQLSAVALPVDTVAPPRFFVVRCHK